MTKLFISMGLLNIKSCLRGNLEIYDLKHGHQLEFVEEQELADVVLTEPNSIYRFANIPTVALSDNENLIAEYENVYAVESFPMSHNDLPPIHTAILSCVRQ